MTVTTVFRTCKFCLAITDDDYLVKYGQRHYAHFACFLNSGHTLAELHPWQIELFPAKVLKDRGLLHEAETLYATRIQEKSSKQRARKKEDEK